MKIDEQDIKNIDFIIDCVLNTNEPVYSDCFENTSFLSSETEEDNEFEFQRLLKIIEHFDIAEVTIGNCGCVEKNHNTKRFKVDGGFYPVYLKMLEEQKRKHKQNKKENTEYTLTKWKYYTFWPLFAIAIFGGGYSIYDFKERLTTKANFQQVQSTKEQTELEQSKPHISPLDQKNQDSSYQTSSDKETLNNEKN